MLVETDVVEVLDGEDEVDITMPYGAEDDVVGAWFCVVVAVAVTTCAVVDVTDTVPLVVVAVA